MRQQHAARVDELAKYLGDGRLGIDHDDAPMGKAARKALVPASDLALRFGGLEDLLHRSLGSSPRRSLRCDAQNDGQIGLTRFFVEDLDPLEATTR